jgi:hypothetical protein
VRNLIPIKLRGRFESSSFVHLANWRWDKNRATVENQTTTQYLKMAPKRGNARDVTPSAPAAAQAGAATTIAPAPTPSVKSQKGRQTYDKVVMNIANYYMDTTPQRTKLIDAFMAFLVVVGGLQFLYCVLAGNYVSSKSFKLESVNIGN